ncbi:MAG: ABC transporter permease [Coriobacteriia bacterium]|nr:ABC transporter permease [Coriobacteriia bacterium]
MGRLASTAATLKDLAPFVARRFLYSLGVIALVTVIVFSLMQFAGDPLARLRNNPNVSPADIQRIERRMGLDKPAYVQFAYWVRDSVRGEGEWSESFSYKTPVLPIVWDRFKNTLVLVGITVLVALAVAIPIGVYSAMRQYSVFDYLATAFSFFGFSMPVFWFGLILQLVLGFYLMDWLGLKEPLFYTASMYSPGMEGDVLNRLRHLVLPVMTLSLTMVAGWSRYQRSAMLDVVRSDYLRTARAKGLPEWAVIGRHALRNALIPVVTIVAIDFATLLGGAIVTETIFAWPGMGRLFYQGLLRRDYPLVMGTVLFSSTVLVAFNLLADIVYGFLDPRIRDE